MFTNYKNLCAPLTSPVMTELLYIVLMHKASPIACIVFRPLLVYGLYTLCVIPSAVGRDCKYMYVCVCVCVRTSKSYVYMYMTLWEYSIARNGCLYAVTMSPGSKKDLSNLIIFGHK